ncbi:MAG: hypothetical protein ACMG6S_15400 [Byssovorax sp.]
MSTNPLYERIVGTVWALSCRPALFTPTGSLEEVVAYLAGMLDPVGPTVLDHSTPDVSRLFAEWLLTRHGGGDPEAFLSVATIYAVLKTSFSDPIDAMWREFELFADGALGVPRGTYPMRMHGCGYASPEECSKQR